MADSEVGRERRRLRLLAEAQKANPETGSIGTLTKVPGKKRPLINISKKGKR